jgi:hypothetical protein
MSATAFASTAIANKNKNNTIYLRNNKKWSETEDRRLVDLYYKHLNFKAVAIDLMRSVDAVQARFVKIAICHHHDKQFLIEKKDSIADRYNINRNDFVRYLKYAGIKDTVSKSQDKNNKYKKHFIDVMDDLIESSDDSDNSIDSDDSDEDYVPDEKVKTAVKKTDKKTTKRVAVYEDKKTDDSSENYDSEYSQDSYDSDTEDTYDESDYDYESDYEKEMYSHLIRKNKQDRNNIKSILKYVKTLHHKITDLEKKLEKKIK